MEVDRAVLAEEPEARPSRVPSQFHPVAPRIGLLIAVPWCLVSRTSVTVQLLMSVEKSHAADGSPATSSVAPSPRAVELRLVSARSYMLGRFDLAVVEVTWEASLPACHLLSADRAVPRVARATERTRVPRTRTWRLTMTPERLLEAQLRRTVVGVVCRGHEIPVVRLLRDLLDEPLATKRQLRWPPWSRNA